MAQVQGHCHPSFSSLKSIFEKNLESGEELGASICVNIAGETVVDVWGGYTDASQSTPWTENTLTPVWSISKTITNLSALLLIDRSLLDPYAPVAQYWPEFAANGKEDIEVRHFLSHTSGLPSWDPPLTTREVYNIPLSTEKLAQQKPWWTPGTASGYHLVSQGHLVGELVRRVSGKSLAQFIRDELATPRNADFYLGVPEEHWPRLAEIVPPPALALPDNLDPDSTMVRAMKGSPIRAELSMTPAFRRAECGASTGFGNARAVNRILSMITLDGEIDGQRFLRPETIDLIFREQSSGVDLVLATNVRFGIGFALPTPDNQDMEWIPQGRVCWWGGWGGAIAIMDLDRKVTITYALNKMGVGTAGTVRTVQYVKAIYAALDEYLASV